MKIDEVVLKALASNWLEAAQALPSCPEGWAAKIAVMCCAEELAEVVDKWSSEQETAA